MKELEHNSVINYVDVESVIKALASPIFRNGTEDMGDIEAWKQIKKNVSSINPTLYKQIQMLNAKELRENGYLSFALCLGLLQD